MTVDARINSIALEVLTDKQYDVWAYHLNGTSIRGIAHVLDISRTTASDRLDAAWRTLRKHGIMVTPDGRPYLEKETA